MMIEISENYVELNCNYNKETGDEIIFKGIVRGFEGYEIKGLYYESEINLAKLEMEKISKEALEKYQIQDVCIFHRIGFVKHGEIAMVVKVISKHRKEGFEAIIYIVDEIKKRVPIWKKELSEKGERWI